MEQAPEPALGPSHARTHRSCLLSRRQVKSRGVSMHALHNPPEHTLPGNGVSQGPYQGTSLYHGHSGDPP